jgi:DNA gyrase subunit B
MGLLGFYLAEGSCSDRNGIRLSIGKGNQRFAEEMARKFSSVFGLPAVTYSSPQRCMELKLVNRVAALAWQHVFGFANVRFHHEADSRSGIQCFRGFANRLSARLSAWRRYCLQESNCLRTSSYDIASGIVYCLEFVGCGSIDVRAGAYGVIREVNGQPCETKHRHWIISVTAKEDLACCVAFGRIMRVRRNWRGSWRPPIGRQARFSDDRRRPDGAADSRNRGGAASNGNVYDFSVEGDENFIAGMGGLCCHNTDADVDGSHIRTCC